jgi:hypothetical protein
VGTAADLPRITNMTVRSGLLVILVLVSACTRGSQEPPSPRPTTPSSSAASGSSTTVSEPGWLAINLRFDPDAFLFKEGSVSFAEIFDETGELVGKSRSRDWVTFFRQQLPPGTYEARTYRRLCGGSCRALDPPRDICRFPVEMTSDRANRFVVVRVGRGDECRVSDKGDVIEIDRDLAVTDLTSFTQALVSAGHEVRVRQGDRWLRRFFLIHDQVVRIEHHEIHVFEYPSRSKLEEISISPDGTGISSKKGLAAIIEWTPHFYRSGRLLVLYLGDAPVLLERLNLLLGPQFAGR